jgi:hypothetical protein
MSRAPGCTGIAELTRHWNSLSSARSPSCAVLRIRSYGCTGRHPRVSSLDLDEPSVLQSFLVVLDASRIRYFVVLECEPHRVRHSRQRLVWRLPFVRIRSDTFSLRRSGPLM